MRDQSGCLALPALGSVFLGMTVSLRLEFNATAAVRDEAASLLGRNRNAHDGAGLCALEENPSALQLNRAVAKTATETSADLIPRARNLGRSQQRRTDGDPRHICDKKRCAVSPSAHPCTRPNP